MKHVKLLMTMAFCIGSFLQGYNQNSDILLPAEVDREILIHHSEYSLSYNTAYVLSHWVAYKVTKAEVDKSTKVKEKYKADPKITGRSADKKDYKDGGYIMAQLFSYLDARSEEAVEETFFTSNIIPAKVAFYKYVWVKIEDLVRAWSIGTDGLYIVCGPILKDSPFPTFGDSKISYPTRYFKAIYDPKNQKAIGFILKNGSTAPKLKGYAISIDEIEEETGLDLFPSLDDDLEEKIESTLNKDDWNFEILD